MAILVACGHPADTEVAPDTDVADSDGAPDTDTTDTDDTDVQRPDVPLDQAIATITGTDFASLGIGVNGVDAYGDGHSAVLVAGLVTGTTCLYRGPLSGALGVPDATTCFEQEMATSFLGVNAVSPGDLDGDGIPDLVLSAVGWGGTGVRGAGRVYVLRGPIAAGTIDVATAYATFTGDLAGDATGYSLAALPDVNGDGIADLAIGSPQSDVGGTDGGLISIVRGPVLPGDHSVFSDVTATVQGGDGLRHGGGPQSDFLGWSSSRMDVDGDGLTDVVASIGGSDLGGTDAGLTLILLGPISSGHFGLAIADIRVVGSTPSSFTGEPLLGARDLDGDGTDDLLLSSTAITPSRVYLMSGADLAAGDHPISEARTTLVGETPTDGFGLTIADAGDVDGDGAGDLLIGAPFADCRATDAGAAYVVHGPIAAGSLAMPTGATRLPGLVAGDSAGLVVGAAGDTDGDGVGEVLVGAPYSSNAGGVAYLLDL
jgi:hypothetical protein